MLNVIRVIATTYNVSSNVGHRSQRREEATLKLDLAETFPLEAAHCRSAYDELIYYI